MRDLMTIAEGARSAKRAVARLGVSGKNRALEAIPKPSCPPMRRILRGDAKTA